MIFGKARTKTDKAVDTKRVRTLAKDVLNQQLWCWGKDIEFCGGNLLIRYGFERIKKSRASRLPGVYRLDIAPTARVVLSAFGIFYGDDRWGGLFVRRYTFRPRLTPASDLAQLAWTPEELPPLTAPCDAKSIERSQRLLVEMLAWIFAYEVWIANTAGVEYRRETLVPWKKNGHVVRPAEEIIFAWCLLGAAAERGHLTRAR